MTDTRRLVERLPTDIGGLPAGPNQRIDHDLLPQEKSCHALADVLDCRKIVNTEEKRCGVEALDAEMVNNLTYYERWIVAFANIFFRKGPITPTELANRMQALESRWNGSVDAISSAEHEVKAARDKQSALECLG